MIGIGNLVAGFVLAAAGVGTTVAVVNTRAAAERDQGVVQRVVDGDTIDVAVGGATTRIRLLNIDTPETVDPNQPVQCLGPEATEFLKSMLLVGTAVGLEYDEERIDRYDRTLAAVFTPDGKLVNAEIARQGLAATMVIGDNDRFYPQVEQARAEAMAASRGLYSADVACTVPAQVEAATAATDSASPIDAQATSADLDTSVAAVAATTATTASTIGLRQALADGRLGVAWAALPPGEQERVTGVVGAALEKAQQNEVAARTAASAAREREAAAARAEDERRQSAARERAAQQEREQQQATSAQLAQRRPPVRSANAARRRRPRSVRSQRRTARSRPRRSRTPQAADRPSIPGRGATRRAARPGGPAEAMIDDSVT